jgi:ubiquinone/menaquinone biosynthesis C-methylase UbiE
MLTKIYYRIHRLFSDPAEREEYSKGYWQDKVRKAALILCQDTKGKLLEVGCGEGLFLVQLAKQNLNLEVWGIDNNAIRIEEAISKAQKAGLNNIKTDVQEAGNLSFAEASFDAIVCINVFFNMQAIDEIRRALAEMCRVCRNSGRIIFEIRNSRNPLLLLKYKLAKYYDYTVKDLPLHCYNPEEIEGLLKGLDLKVIRKIFIGAPLLRSLAPVIIYEAEKNV